MDTLIPRALSAFFASNPRVALAFSGGTDSAYLLYAARTCGCEVRAYCVQSAFQPAFELEDARHLAESVGAKMEVISVDVLADHTIVANPADRCYHCKRALFTALFERARSDGFDVLIDGTNASDDANDRPGMLALKQLGVLSPLRLCGITKAEVREYSRGAGLFTWSKPAYACLATRVPTGEPITAELLARVEAAELALFKLGFSDLRVRIFHGAARLQFPAAQLETVVKRRREIREKLKPWFDIVLLDMEDRG